jgi:hypothetical protein
MAGTATGIYPQLHVSPAVQILPADTTNLKTLLTPGANGSVINRIWVASTDTSARDLQFYVTISSVDYLIGTLSIPANSGFTNSVPMVSVFESTQFPAMFLDNNGNKIMRLASGVVLKVKCLTTVTTAKAISITCQGGDF